MVLDIGQDIAKEFGLGLKDQVFTVFKHSLLRPFCLYDHNYAVCLRSQKPGISYRDDGW